MANVQFLRGTHANLKNVTPVEGAFYLTTDTHRLYTGIDSAGSVELVELNKSIYEVDTFAELNGEGHPVFEEGQFAFIKNQNALAVYKNGEWLQINPDTHLFIRNNSPLFTVGGVVPTTDSNENIIKQSSTITGTVEDTKDNLTVANSLSGNVTLSVTGSLTMTVNGREIILGYTAPEASRVELESVDRINGGEVVGLDIKTEQDNISTGTVSIEAGTNTSITKDNGVYKVNADNMCVTSFSGSPLATNGFQIELADKNHVGAGTLKATIDPSITVKDIDKNAVTGVHFNNGVAALDTYNTGAVDSLIEKAKQTIDAMTYKGVINNNTELENLINGTTPSSIGDTYKVGTSFVTSVLAGEKNLHAGDLIICNSSTGEETNTGIIDSEDFEFEVIESGNDYVYEASYSGTGDTRTINLNERLYGSAGSGTPVMGISITAGNKLSLSNVNNGAITIDHDQITAPAASANNYSVPDRDYSGANSQDVLAISSLTLDDYGHVTDFGITNYKTTDTHTTISAVENSNTVANNIVTQKVKVTASNGEPKEQSRTISSSTLTFASTGNQALSIDLQWGSF